MTRGEPASTRLPGQPIRVLLVDDSVTYRAYLRAALQNSGGFEVVGEVADGLSAAHAVQQLKPHVVALDLSMPACDGVEAVRRIMATRPTPLVIVTVASASKEAFAALEAGALDVVDKSAPVEDLRATLRLMSEVQVVSRRRGVPTRLVAAAGAIELVGVGASTGGPAALAELFGRLPRTLPVPMVIAQHLAASYLPGLVEWLSGCTALAVVLGKAGQALSPGTAYFPPPGFEVRFTQTGVLGLVPCRDPKGPTVDTLFQSLAETYGPRAVGVLLSGMGRDGSRGLLALRGSGATTIAQDESTSVVYGMPKAAVELGAASKVLPLDQIAFEILALVSSGGRDRPRR